MLFLKTAFLFICLLSLFSCSVNEDLKEISGSYEFNQPGKFAFVINANNIKANIILSGANGGETILHENVVLEPSVEYTAIVGDGQNFHTEIRNNLVQEFIAYNGDEKGLPEAGSIRIEWKGFD